MFEGLWGRKFYTKWFESGCVFLVMSLFFVWFLICEVLFVSGLVLIYSKSAIKSTMARIEMVRKRRKAMENFLTKDIADLLRRGHDTNAYSMVILCVSF